MIDQTSRLWLYLSVDEKQLVNDGQLLIDDRSAHPNEHLSDYSYLVFPFAKLYEGFLKHLFRDLGVINSRQYTSDHFRIGKVLSPNLVRHLAERSAYGQIKKRWGRNLADTLWNTWKEGRNLVFHYFPANFRKLTQEEAIRLVGRIEEAMRDAVDVTHVLQTSG